MASCLLHCFKVCTSKSIKKGTKKMLGILSVLSVEKGLNPNSKHCHWTDFDNRQMLPSEAKKFKKAISRLLFECLVYSDFRPIERTDKHAEMNSPRHSQHFVIKNIAFIHPGRRCIKNFKNQQVVNALHVYVFFLSFDVNKAEKCCIY